MIKEFCDGCGIELTHDNRLPAKDGKVELRSEYKDLKSDRRLFVHLKTGDGEWCRFCVVDLVMTMDNRPRAA